MSKNVLLLRSIRKEVQKFFSKKFNIWWAGWKTKLKCKNLINSTLGHKQTQAEWAKSRAWKFDKSAAVTKNIYIFH